MMEKFKKFRKKLILLSAALCVNFSATPNSQAMGPSQVKKYNSNLEKEDEKSSDGVVRRTVKSLINAVAIVGTVFCAGKYYGRFGGGTIMPEHFLSIIKISGSVGVITSTATEFGFDTVCSAFSKLGNFFSKGKDSDEDLHTEDKYDTKEAKEGDSKKKDKKDKDVKKIEGKSDAVSKAQLAGRKFIKTLSDLLVFRGSDVDESVRSQIKDIENEAFYNAPVLWSLTLNAKIDARSKKIKKVSREIIEKEMQDEFVKDFKLWFTQNQAGVVAKKLEEATKKIEKILSDLDIKKKELEKQTSPDSKKKESKKQTSSDSKEERPTEQKSEN